MLKTFKLKSARFLSDDSGSIPVEYAMVGLLVSTAVIVVLPEIATLVTNMLETVINGFNQPE